MTKYHKISNIMKTFKSNPAMMTNKIMLVIMLTLFVTALSLSTLHALEITYTYDNLNRITSATYKEGTNITTLSYQYDPLGNITTYAIGDATTGTVQVNPEPNEANGSWTLTGSDGYSQSGTGDQPISNRAPGSYTITWNDTANWIKPTPSTETKSLTSGGSLIFTGTYSSSHTPPPVTTLSVPGGSYNTPQTVTLSTSETATIYYTIDGSDPTTSGTRIQYNSANPIAINTTTTLRYYAVDAAGNASAVQSQTYTIEQALFIEKIVFSSDRTGNWDIWMMNPDGSNQVQLTTSAANDQSPVISPDGTKIAFTSDRSGKYQIWVMNADGSNQRQLTDVTNGAMTPSWNRDGSKIYYQDGLQSNRYLWTVNADGSSVTPLNLYTTSGAWFSPDGDKFCFEGSADSNPNNYNLFVANADGTEAVNLSSAVGLEGYETPYNPTAWSKNGKILITAQEPNWHNTTDYRIYTVNSDGSGYTVILDEADKSSFHAGWSPDEQQIVFVSYRSGNWDIWKMNKDGTNLQQLTTNAASNSMPHWGRISTSSTSILNVIKSGTGAGTVTSNSAGINCGSDCIQSCTSGISVTLFASADIGSTFTGWSGACSGTLPTCTVTMDAAKSVTATFSLLTTTITGLPSSTSNATSYDVTIGGNGLTAYKYKLDNGAWSAEIPISIPIHLTGLINGQHILYVIGNDGNGNWQPESQVKTLTWEIVYTGDINSDGSVNLTDAILAMQVISGVTPTQAINKAADVNRDGKIGIEEAIYIFQDLSGLRIHPFGTSGWWDLYVPAIQSQKVDAYYLTKSGSLISGMNILNTSITGDISGSTVYLWSCPLTLSGNTMTGNCIKDGQSYTLSFVESTFHFTNFAPGESLTTSPQFAWTASPGADKYYIQVVKDNASWNCHETGGCAGIWSKDGIVGTSVNFNSDGTASEQLLPGNNYRVRIYSRTNSQTGMPIWNNPTTYIDTTMDVAFKVKN